MRRRTVLNILVLGQSGADRFITATAALLTSQESNG
jgi:hypothetical protein